MKKWIAVTLALLLMVSIGTVRVDAAKDKDLCLNIREESGL